MDDLIIQSALEFNIQGHKVYVATNDKELRKKCVDLGLRVVYIRQKQSLAVE